MTENNTTQTGAKAPSFATILAWAGLATLLGITAVAAFYNAGGWLKRGFGELAAFAVVTELAALVMVACAELVWGQRKRSKALRGAALFVLIVSAVGCEVFNGYGGFIAWQDTVAERAETLTEPRRNEISAAERRLQMAIDAAQARIDAVPAPDMSGGPLNDAAALEAYDALTSADRAELAAKKAAFDAIDRTIVHPEAPFSNGVVFAFLAFIGFVKVTGPWAIIQAFHRSTERKRGKTERSDTETGTPEGNVIAFPRGEETRRIVIALREAKVPFREIERLYGVPLATQHRWCKAQNRLT